MGPSSTKRQIDTIVGEAPQAPALFVQLLERRCRARLPAKASRFPTPRGLTVGFPVRHLSRNLLARHLARDVSDGLLIKPLGLLLFLQPLPLRPRLVVAAGAIAGAVGHAQVGPKEAYGNGQDDGGVLLACYLAHRLEEPQLQRLRTLQSVRCLPETLGGLVLALSSYDLGSPLPLALGLTRHRPLHLRRNLHVLDLNHADLHSPGVGLLVDDPLELFVYLLAVDEQVVEVLLPEHAA